MCGVTGNILENKEISESNQNVILDEKEKLRKLRLAYYENLK